MNNILKTTRRPDISFYPDGRIDITARVTKALSLQPGDVIDILTDGVEFYLYIKYKKALGRHHAQLFPTNKGMCNNLRAHSVALTKAIGAVISLPARLMAGKPISSEYGTIIPIITKKSL